MFETYDYGIESNRYTIERPILVIPGISEEERGKVHEWESENAIKEKESKVIKLVSGL